MNKLRRMLASLRADRRGVAMIEFAYALPMFLVLALGGVELTHYVTTKMRVSQIALHIADHASRIGSGSLLAAKTISETQINDALTGAGLQAGELNLYQNGRVILSSLEPVANPNSTSRYKIAWQRCRGAKVHASTYGVAGDTGMVGMGPADRPVTSPDNGATMFVEVYYVYTPILGSSWAPSLTLTEIASMTVRDRRDLTQVYNSEGATRASC